MRARLSASRDPKVALALARATGVPLSDTRALLAEARVWPLELDAAGFDSLKAAMAPLGLTIEAVDVPPTRARCGTHPQLTPDTACVSCGTIICVLCRDAQGQPACAACSKTQRRAATWKARRVAVWLVVLAVVGVAAAQQTQRRSRRTEWKHPVQVTVVLVSEVPLDDAVVSAWREGLREVAAWFAGEAARLGAPLARPIEFTLIEPPRQAPLPQRAETGGGWLEETRAALAYRDAIAALAATTGDVRLVVALGQQPAEETARVEGAADAGGELGLVHATASDTSLGLELIALAHELLHCLGALDAYDAQGHALVPAGLAEPEREPRYPQRFAEVMVGEVPDTASTGHVPKSLSDVRLGPTTAAAIGW